MVETTTIGAGDNLTNPTRDREEQVLMLVSFWTGAVMFGIYTVLFIGAVYTIIKKGVKKRSASMVFFVSMFIMYTLNIIYFGITIYRIIQSYALGQSPVPSMPIIYFRDFATWHSLSYPVIMNLLVTHADALVIYRCFIVWKRNYYVIAIPCILLLLGIATNIVVMYWLGNPTKIAFETVHPFFSMIYPVNLAQNILTTGLISYKIYLSHRKSQAAGLKVALGVDMITIIRIIVESAMIYTVQQMIVLILYCIDHPAQPILHATMVPTVGIVFTLIAIRTHAAQSEASSNYSRQPHTSLIRSTARGVDLNQLAISVSTQQHRDSDMEFSSGNSTIKMDVLRSSDRDLDSKA